MTNKKKSDQQLIVQALNAAETNIRLAKTLLSGVATTPPKTSSKELPGIVGTFDGENMIAEDGKKYPVNPNYASKSVLVYGDTLKRVEMDGRERFKQIARVKRHKVEGILAKKSGKWTAVTADGSYAVSPVAVDFYKGEEGDEVVVVLPLDDKGVPYAALESIKKEEPSARPAPTPKASGAGVTSVIKKAVKKTVAVKKPVPTKKKVVIKKKPTPEPVAEVENDEELR